MICFEENCKRHYADVQKSKQQIQKTKGYMYTFQLPKKIDTNPNYPKIWYEAACNTKLTILARIFQFRKKKKTERSKNRASKLQGIAKLINRITKNY